MAIETYDFSGYVPTTKDTGWSLTVAVILLCTFINLTLPIAVRLAAACDTRKSSDVLEKGGESSSGDTKDPKTSKTSSPLRDGNDAPSLAPSENGLSTLSAESNASSSVLTQVSLAILEGRRHRKTGRKLQQRIPKPTAPSLFSRAVQPRNDDEDSSIASGSVLSSLHEDAVSISDAIDGGDFTPALRALTEEEEPMDISDQFWEIADWDAESKRLGSLALQYTVQGCSQGIFQLINVAVIGHLLGVKEANAYVMVSILLEFSATIPYGFGEAVGTLVPHAMGAKNNVLVGRYLQLSMILYTALSLPGVIIWALWAEDVVLWFGFDEETAALSQKFAYPYLAMFCLQGLDSPIFEFLGVTGHEKYSTVVQLIHFTADTLTIVIIVSAGVNNLVVIGTAQCLLAIIISLSNLALVLHRGWLDEYWEGFARTLSIRDGRAVHTTMITAIPLSISWLLMYGEWEVLTIFASAMGPAEVAAWGILGFLWDAFENITEGLASAAEVRVGFRMGGGQPQKAKLAAYKSIYIGLIVASFSTGVLFILAEYIPKWFTPDATLQRMIFDTLPLIGFGQVLMVVGSVSWGVVGAQGRVRLATAIEFATSWLVVIPLCGISLYVFNFDLVGFVAALVFGYTVGGYAMGFIILRSNWSALSQVVISRNAREGVSWEDNDWDELPPYVQKAASCLGYTKEIWNDDEDPPSKAKDWGDLTRDEKEAAALLGFDRTTWGSEDGTSSDEDDSPKEEARRYDDLDWKELPRHARDAAITLGFNKKLWDSGGEPGSCSRSWKRLKPTERDAAKTLGYSQETWDEPDELPREKESSAKQASKKRPRRMPWKDLPPFRINAAEILGFNEKMWNGGESPPSLQKYWGQLARKEKYAASVFGFDEQNWATAKYNT